MTENFVKENLKDFIYINKSEQGEIDELVASHIKFAKFHVLEALKSASKQCPYDDRCNQDIFLQEKILNCYPLNNIL